MIDLDHIEAVARAAKEDHDLSGFRSWGTWFEEMNIGIAEQRLAEECSPDVVLALVARVRELELSDDEKDALKWFAENNGSIRETHLALQVIERLTK